MRRVAVTVDAYRLMALDGVTSAFELEVGVPDVRRFIAARQGRSPVHFGVAASYLAARTLAWKLPLPVSIFGPEAGIIPQSSPATNEPPTPERLEVVDDGRTVDGAAPGRAIVRKVDSHD